MAKNDPALKKAQRELEEQKRQLEESSSTPVEPEGKEPEAPKEEQLELDLNDARVDASEQLDVVPDSANDDDFAKQIAEKDAKIEELTRRINAEDGARGGEIQKLRQENASLLDQVQGLSRSVEELKSLSSSEDNPKAISEGAFKGLSEEDLAGYDESALNVIVKVAENISGMKQTHPDLTEDVAALKEREAVRDFTLAAERLAPGFLSVNGDSLMGIPPDKEWIQFLNSPIDPDLPEETWGEVAQRVGTPEAAATVFKKFQARQGLSKPDQSPETSVVSDTEKPSLEGQVVPGKSASSPKIPESKQNQVLSRSEYEKFKIEASKPGRYTQETRDKLRTFQKAELEGRLK